MAELLGTGGEEGPVRRGEGTMELDHCLKLLKGASSDTERMAGLLVVMDTPIPQHTCVTIAVPGCQNDQVQ